MENNLSNQSKKHFIPSSIFVFGLNESKADTLLQSLKSAYLKNSKLNAERASMRASKEEKRAAVSEFLPSVTISANPNPAGSKRFLTSTNDSSTYDLAHVQ